MGCIFCEMDHDSVREDILFQSEHFYVKSCLASVALGHVLVIPKEHYACYGALPQELEKEYLQVKEKTIGRIREKLFEPFLLEHGVWGQSVAHAHTHIIPLQGERYFISSILEEMIFPSGVSYKEGGLETMRELYHTEGGYLSIEEKGRNLVCSVEGFSYEDWMPKIGYRHFFRRFSHGTLLLWKSATEEDKMRVKELGVLTGRILRF